MFITQYLAKSAFDLNRTVIA